MKDFMEFVVKHLVDSPDNVNIVETKQSEKSVILKLTVAHDDIGKVIGKQGKTAQSLRTLLTAVAAKDGIKATLNIVD